MSAAAPLRLPRRTESATSQHPARVTCSPG